MQQQELACVAAIIDITSADCAAVSIHLFTVIICTIALHRTDTISDMVQ